MCFMKHHYTVRFHTLAVRVLYSCSMQNQIRLALLIGAAAMILAGPSMAAETKPKPREDDGVQKAIAYQRAKDRADAAQARKEARNPEHFTYAEPKRSSENGLANEQKREALERSSDKNADRSSEKGTERQSPPPRQ